MGLTRGEDGPQIAMLAPLLHDRGMWPRTLGPGQEVVAHFGSDLDSNPVLPKVRRSYAATIDGRYLLGDASALQHYMARRKSMGAPGSAGPRTGARTGS